MYFRQSSRVISKQKQKKRVAKPHVQYNHSTCSLQSDVYEAALTLLSLPNANTVALSETTINDATQSSDTLATPQMSFESFVQKEDPKEESQCKSTLKSHDVDAPFRTTDQCSVSSEAKLQDHDGLKLSQDTSESAFYGSVSIAMPDDEYNLSPVHCFIRKYGIEAFVLTNEEALDKQMWSARNFKVKPNIVGMRCMYCKDVPVGARSPKSIHYPSSTHCIYYSMENWQRHHAAKCACVPKSILRELTKLMNKSKTGSGGRRNYWSDSAISLGMVNTSNGIVFRSNPEMNRQVPEQNETKTDVIQFSNRGIEKDANDCASLLDDIDTKGVSPYLLKLLSQMEVCKFSEEDRTGSRSKVKDIKIGYTGMQCKHCHGMAGVGRYFPLSIHALSLANSDRNLHNHLQKCRRCPASLKKELNLLKVGGNSSHTSGTKLKRGSRKAFFTEIWQKLHPHTQSSGISEPTEPTEQENGHEDMDGRMSSQRKTHYQSILPTQELRKEEKEERYRERQVCSDFSNHLEEQSFYSNSSSATQQLWAYDYAPMFVPFSCNNPHFYPTLHNFPAVMKSHNDQYKKEGKNDSNARPKLARGDISAYAEL